MPLPWLLGLGVGGAIAKIVKDVKDDIEDTNEQAEDIVYDSTNAANQSRKACSEAIADLKNLKIYILNHSVKSFVGIFEKVHNVELTEFTAINELKKFKIDKHSFEDLEELKERGINKSIIHVDFMIGSKDLDIVGYDKDGKEYQIFKNGNWAI